MSRSHELPGISPAQTETGEERQPYVFTVEELTMPPAVKGKPKTREEQRTWLDNMIAQQREGIEHGVKPQNLRGSTPGRLHRVWLQEVWKPYLETLPPRERRGVSSVTGSIKHTRPTVGSSGTLSLLGQHLRR